MHKSRRKASGNVTLPDMGERQRRENADKKRGTNLQEKSAGLLYCCRRHRETFLGRILLVSVCDDSTLCLAKPE
jgi:hypothetical protein